MIAHFFFDRTRTTMGLILVLTTVLLIHVSDLRGQQVTLNLETATIQEIQAAFQAGALTSEGLVKLYLKRIETYDQKGPRLNTVITLNDRALSRARALDEERRQSGPRSLLHGIPIVVKDLLDTHDMPTSGGFLPMAQSQPGRDAFVVDRLRKAGAIILAKLNQSDWFAKADFGASSLAGQVQNPYKLGYTPGGSSSGTGAAVAAYFASAGLGTETTTSVRNPSSEHNLFGLAATQGLVSREGILSNSFTLERAGPMARSVYDVAAVLSIIAGFDPEDLVTQTSIGKIPAQGYTSFVDPEGLRGARIGVLRDLFSSTPPEKEGVALIEAAVSDIRDQGAFILDPVTSGLDLYPIIRNERLGHFEKKLTTQMYLDRLGPGAIFRSMGEMIEKHPDLVRDHLRERNQVGPLDQEAEYISLLKTRRVMRQLMVSLMDEYQLDALIYPFKTLPAWEISEGMTSSDWLERIGAQAYNPLSSMTGLPALVAPAGLTREGLPIALEFLGRPFSEATLIRLASGYEHSTRHRTTPPSTPPLPGEVVHYSPQ